MPTHTPPLMTRIGRAGHIAGYDVLIADDTLVVVHAASHGHWAHPVPNFGTSITALSRRPGFRVGWARMEDDAEILFFYDRDDAGFGYALNLDCGWCSEWGYAPFGRDAA